MAKASSIDVVVRGDYENKDIQRAIRDLEKLKTTSMTLGAQFKQFGSQLQGVGQSISGVGKSLSLGVTAPILALGTASVFAATKFESAFAGVRKTVEATEEEFATLERGIRDMSLRLPASAEAIAAVGESAGQLGIQTSNILSFTETMIALGEATNLSATDAATALARLANITQMPQENFDRLGSSVVALGNNLATTEAEIVDMSLGLAGAGKQIGLTEAEILAFAGALSSVGIEAAAGGSAFSRAFLNMQVAVMDGGERLEAFAKVAGTTAQDFATQFENEPAAAVISFINGLQRIQEEGGNVVQALESVGITEIRVRDAFLRSAGAGTLLADSLAISSQAWGENTALTIEAGQRYATTESQLAMLRNQAQEFARTLGEALIPMLSAGLEAAQPFLVHIQNLAQAFANMNPQSQQMIVGLLGLAAAIGPVLLVVGKLITAIGGVISVIGSLGVVMNPVGLAIAAVVVAVAALAAGILYLWHNSEEFRAAVIRIWEMIRSAVVEVIDMIQTKLEENSETVEQLRVAFQKIADFIMTYVVPILMTFIEQYLKVIVQVLLFIVQGILNIIEAFVRFQAALLTMWEAISVFVDNVQTAFTDMKDGLQLIWDNVYTIISGVMDKVKTKVAEVINFIIDGWNSLSFSVPSITIGDKTFGGFTIGVPQIPRLAMAEGGIVMGPTVALVGEAGPEAVLPLTGRNAAAAGIGTGTTINLTVNAGMGTDGASVGRQVVEAIRQYERQSGKVFVAA